MTNETLAVVIATLIGPLAAVIFTVWFDHRRESQRQIAKQEKDKNERQLWIFRSLVKDRFFGISNDFVAAINLVEIEFYGEEKVINSWNKLRDAHHTTNGQEQIRRRTNELLIEIAKVLGFTNLNFTDPGYSPQIYGVDYERTVLRDQLLINLLKNEKIVLNVEQSTNK